MIRTAMRERGAELIAGGCPYAVFVVPLLVEKGSWRDNVDRVLLIDCSEATQMRACAPAPISMRNWREASSPRRRLARSD